MEMDSVRMDNEQTISRKVEDLEDSTENVYETKVPISVFYHTNIMSH